MWLCIIRFLINIIKEITSQRVAQMQLFFLKTDKKCLKNAKKSQKKRQKQHLRG